MSTVIGDCAINLSISDLATDANTNSADLLFQKEGSKTFRILKIQRDGKYSTFLKFNSCGIDLESFEMMAYRSVCAVPTNSTSVVGCSRGKSRYSSRLKR